MSSARIVTGLMSEVSIQNQKQASLLKRANDEDKFKTNSIKKKKLASRYIQIYEQITGANFSVDSRPALERMRENLTRYQM